MWSSGDLRSDVTWKARKARITAKAESDHIRLNAESLTQRFEHWDFHAQMQGLLKSLGQSGSCLFTLNRKGVSCKFISELSDMRLCGVARSAFYFCLGGRGSFAMLLACSSQRIVKERFPSTKDY